MDQNGSVNGSSSPLLSREHLADHKKSPNFFLRKSAKWVLKFLMWAVFISWVALSVLYPSDFAHNLFDEFATKTEGDLFGQTGIYLLAFSVPVFVLAFLAVIYLMIKGDEEEEIFQKEDKAKRSPRFRLWTFPALVDGPFGVVSAIEFIGIILFLLWLIWAISVYTIQNLSEYSEYDDSTYSNFSLILDNQGLEWGQIGIFFLAFLFLPISRGSVLLRVIDVPFEHATRYHVWLGHLTMFVFTVHGFLHIIAWTMQGRLVSKILEWRALGVANLPGVIGLGVGLLMWVASLHRVRKHYFEVFFYTHQLYIVFVVLLALHAGDYNFSIALGGIFLFMLDRFLRFIQSRKTVDVISATSLPCGSVEIVLSKPPNLQYNALSFIFLHVRELSRLQWHPFSVSSSPMDGKHYISILIKSIGSWTGKLKDKISNADGEHQERLLQSQITASVEGPYGHESLYHLKYKHLVLVAGGIGISPFLAVLSDIFNRIKQAKPCLTRSILIVWAIKGSDELSLLSMLNMDSISPILPDMLDLDLDIQIYVTREQRPTLEEGRNPEIVKHSLCPTTHRSSMSSLVGTGDNLWVGLYVISSIIGLFAFIGILDAYYINPYGISAWWYKGLLLLGCMLASVVLIGGFIVILWHLCGRTSSSTSLDQQDHVEDDLTGQKHESGHNFLRRSSTLHYGRRPSFRDVFRVTGDRWGQVDIGVLACGPPSLQSSVAKEIRSHSFQRRSKQPVFHFNSHSFDL